MTGLPATLANMQAVADRPGVMAYSPDTGEECSANPRDYWYLSPTDYLIDGNGTPRILVIRRTVLEDVTL